MPDGIDDELLFRYFADECSPEEEAAVEEWVAEAEPHRDHFEEMRRLWTLTERSASNWEVDRMWASLSNRIQEENGSSEGRKERRARDPKRRRKRPSWQMGARAAAGLVVAVVIATVSWFVFSSGPQSPSGETAQAEAQTYHTDEGERARVQLSDGSQVVLNAKSRLTVQPFTDSTRDVSLEGEALFTVSKDRDRPFRVRADGSVTRVLGTVFSVAAYPGEDTVDVVVAEGKVQLRSERAQRGVDLTARERGRLAARDTLATEDVVDPTQFLAWTEGRLVFRDAPFHEVARRLGRQYGLEVQKADPSLRVDRLNATFSTDQSASEVLSIVARTLSLEYSREEKTVTFSRESSSG